VLVERLTEGIDTGEPALRDDGLDIPSTGKYIHRKDTEQAHVSIGARGLPRGIPIVSLYLCWTTSWVAA